MTKVPPVVRELGKELYDMRKVGLIASFAFLSKPEIARMERAGQPQRGRRALVAR